MAESELWRKTFEELKLFDPEYSTAIFENERAETSPYRAEMLEYKKNSKNISEKCLSTEEKAFGPDLNCSGYVYKKPPITDDSYYCKSQRPKNPREKSKSFLPKTNNMEVKETEKNCEETLPEEKKIDQKVQVSSEECEKSKISPDPEEKKLYNHSSAHGYNPTKSLNRRRNYKKIKTPEERNLLKVMRQSGTFQKAKESKVNKDRNSRNLDTYSHRNSALADGNVSESNDDVDSESNIPPGGWVCADRYTQADRMASHPMILSEVWDIEEDWNWRV